jgi:hypothetical protein
VPAVRGETSFLGIVKNYDEDDDNENMSLICGCENGTQDMYRI